MDQYSLNVGQGPGASIAPLDHMSNHDIITSQQLDEGDQMAGSMRTLKKNTKHCYDYSYQASVDPYRRALVNDNPPTATALIHISSSETFNCEPFVNTVEQTDVRLVSHTACLNCVPDSKLSVGIDDTHLNLITSRRENSKSSSNEHYSNTNDVTATDSQNKRVLGDKTEQSQRRSPINSLGSVDEDDVLNDDDKDEEGELYGQPPAPTDIAKDILSQPMFPWMRSHFGK